MQRSTSAKEKADMKSNKAKRTRPLSRNGKDDSEGLGKALPPIPSGAFVVVHRWRARSSRSRDLPRAWADLARALQAHGALASRLFAQPNGTWLCYNIWPDRRTWERARAAPAATTEIFQRLRDDLAEELPPVFLTAEEAASHPIARLLV